MKKATQPIPEGMAMLTPHLWFNGNCAEAIEYYQKVFDAKSSFPPMKGPDGKSIIHAMLKIGDSNIMMADAWPGSYEQGPTNFSTTGFFLYVDDCDSIYNRAIKNGCEVINEIMDAFWGDRMGKVKDPFGHCWSIATYKWDMTMEEIQRGQDEWAKTLQ